LALHFLDLNSVTPLLPGIKNGPRPAPVRPGNTYAACRRPEFGQAADFAQASKNGPQRRSAFKAATAVWGINEQTFGAEQQEETFWFRYTVAARAKCLQCAILWQ
jgi:hypothetical protein